MASVYNQNIAFAGLGSITMIVPQAGAYFLEGKLSLPRLAAGSTQSSVVVTVTQNASNKYTGIAGADGFYLDLNCAAGDTLVVTLASGAAGDQGLNVIKMNLSVGQGQ